MSKNFFYKSLEVTKDILWGIVAIIASPILIPYCLYEEYDRKKRDKKWRLEREKADAIERASFVNIVCTAQGGSYYGIQITHNDFWNEVKYWETVMLSSNRFLIKTGKDKKELYYVTLTFNRTLDKVYRLEPLRKVMYNKISEV